MAHEERTITVYRDSVNGRFLPKEVSEWRPFTSQKQTLRLRDKVGKLKSTACTFRKGGAR